MLPYEIFHRRRFANKSEWSQTNKWELFISGFVNNERARTVYDLAAAQEKWWLVHGEYNFSATELPSEPHYSNPKTNEAQFIRDFFTSLQPRNWTEVSICIDITGLMRPHIMFLVKYLAHMGVRQFDAIYTEPSRYIARHKTRFSVGPVSIVRPVEGFSGLHVPDAANDSLLLLGVGYEHELVKLVAEDKLGARKVRVFPFPPLQADFYQESVLQAEVTAESLGEAGHLPPRFAPAYDPFGTALALHEIVEEEKQHHPFSNLYLSPLATRAQALGFALYYVYTWENQPASIIYPFASEYSKDTSSDVAGIWRYTVELP